MTVYADLLFFINFAFVLELMLILLKLSSKKIPPLRLFLSACLGGAQGVFVFIPYFRILASPPAGLILPFFMTMLVMYPEKPAGYIKSWLLFLGCSFVFSGMMNYFGIKTVWGLFLLVPVYGILCMMKKRTLKKTMPTYLYYGNRKIRLEGFCDSGNRMTYLGTPVILGSRQLFRRLFGKEFNIFAASEWVDRRDICEIPYQALGKSGTITGIRIDKAVIDGRCYENLILGYFSDNFSDDLILNGIMM